MAKVVSVFGARPNLVKLATLHLAFTCRLDYVNTYGGKHYDYAVFYQYLP